MGYGWGGGVMWI